MNADFDLFIRDNWPIGTPRECTQLIKDQDCLERDEMQLCTSCRTFARLARKFDKLEQERARTKANTEAAINLILTEAELMETPVTRAEALTVIGHALDAAHECVETVLKERK